MPELPDLTVFAENLNKLLAGRRIATVYRHSGGGRLNVSSEELSRALVGTAVDKVECSGKELCFQNDNRRLLFIHLMPNGYFELEDPPFERAAGDAIVSMVFADGARLTLRDLKGLGYCIT